MVGVSRPSVRMLFARPVKPFRMKELTSNMLQAARKYLVLSFLYDMSRQHNVI